jgi:hypothetical protein
VPDRPESADRARDALGPSRAANRRRLFAVLLVLGLAAVLAAIYVGFGGDKTPPLKILKTIPLGGQGKWDYVCVDAQARRLYVPRSTTVQVVDLDNGVLVDTIAE